MDDPEGDIEYDYKSLGDDKLLINTDEEKYCLKQVYKMCHYI